MHASDTQIMQALREIASNLQVSDAKRAHAQMEIVSIFAGVDTSTIYAVTEGMAEEANGKNCVARAMCWDSAALVSSLARLNRIARAA